MSRSATTPVPSCWRPTCRGSTASSSARSTTPGSPSSRSRRDREVEPLDRIGVTHRLMAPPDADVLAGLLHRLGDGLRGDARSTSATGPRDRRAVAGSSRCGAGRERRAGRRSRCTSRSTTGAPAAIPCWSTATVGHRRSCSCSDSRPSRRSPRAVRDAANGWPTPLAASLLAGPDGLRVLGGLPRADLWPEVRDRSWRAVLDAARVDERRRRGRRRGADRGRRGALVRPGAVPSEPHEPRRAAGGRSGADGRACRSDRPASRDLRATGCSATRCPTAADASSVVLNQTPSSSRRLQECSSTVEEWTGHPPIGFLPREEAFTRVLWEGRPLSRRRATIAVAARSSGSMNGIRR